MLTAAEIEDGVRELHHRLRGDPHRMRGTFVADACGMSVLPWGPCRIRCAKAAVRGSVVYARADITVDYRERERESDVLRNVCVTMLRAGDKDFLPWHVELTTRAMVLPAESFARDVRACPNVDVLMARYPFARREQIVSRKQDLAERLLLKVVERVDKPASAKGLARAVPKSKPGHGAQGVNAARRTRR
jgi:hypothetical protein